MTIGISELWQAAGIFLGLQIVAFSWRIQREIVVSGTRDIVRLAPADYLNLASMLLSLFGVFILPTMGMASVRNAQMSFGLVALLFVGHVLTLAAHYQLYGKGRERGYAYCPLQEFLALCVVLITVAGYIVFWKTTPI